MTRFSFYLLSHVVHWRLVFDTQPTWKCENNVNEQLHTLSFLESFFLHLLSNSTKLLNWSQRHKQNLPTNMTDTCRNPYLNICFNRSLFSYLSRQNLLVNSIKKNACSNNHELLFFFFELWSNITATFSMWAPPGYIYQHSGLRCLFFSTKMKKINVHYKFLNRLINKTLS